MIDAEPLLAAAVQAALRAAAALEDHRAAWAGVEAEVGREVKIRADREAEALILDTLDKLTGLPALSEETGWTAGRAADRFWAVDPLDGSVNYALGYPHCAVSIGLIADGQPVLGVVDCFALRERYTGIVGQGAQRNGVPIAPSAVTDPARGVLSTGIPSGAATDDAAMAALVERLRRWRKVRMIGSAAAALVNVACGRADAYHESGGKLWDVAGGCAIAAAAGCHVTLQGPALDGPLEVAATNGRLPLPV